MPRNKILIADDAELNREILSAILGRQYDFIFAQNGMEVIEILNSGEAVDLILLDVNMPKMDGFEVLRIMNERQWIDSISVIIISAEDSIEFITKAYSLGVTDYISRPFNATVVSHRVANTLRMYTNQKRLTRLIEMQVYEREKVNSAMIDIFSNVIELRNHESGSHTLNVQTITRLLLDVLIKKPNPYGLTETDISLISSLAALHDIGKIKVPEDILNKPGKLTPEEWELMKSHSVEGEQLLSGKELDQNSKFVRTARSICRWHHEKWDGKGYPDGLSGDDIPIAAQVVSMADVYDALTSERCYKKAFSHSKAIEMILGGECGAFNPLLLECLSEISDSLENIMQHNRSYDFREDVSGITNELLRKSNLPYDNFMHNLLDNETKKKEFFMECSDGVAFEYDRLLQKIALVNPYKYKDTDRRVTYMSRDSKDTMLPPEYWDLLREKLLLTDRDNPIAETEVMLNIDNKLVPHKARVMALRPERDGEYTHVLGHFTPTLE